MKILQIGQTDLRSEVKLEQSTKWEFWEVEQIAEFLVPYNLPKNQLVLTLQLSFSQVQSQQKV